MKTINKKGKSHKPGDFCDLCKKRNKEGYTFVEHFNFKHELAFCETCRRHILAKLIEQYLLEQDMQGLVNELLSNEIQNLRKLVVKHIEDKYKNENGRKAREHR